MKLFKSALVCTVISSAAIVLIPLEEISTSWENAMRFAVPIIFWAGLAAEQILFGLCRKNLGGAAEKPKKNKGFYSGVHSICGTAGGFHRDVGGKYRRECGAVCSFVTFSAFAEVHIYLQRKVL